MTPYSIWLRRWSERIGLSRLRFRLATWIAEPEIRYWSDRCMDAEEECEYLVKKIHVTIAERDGYKAYIDRIVDLKVEALNLQPMPPIIVQRSSDK